MDIVIIIISLSLLLSTLFQYRGIVLSKQFIEEGRIASLHSPQATKKKIYVLIPVLFEETNISKAVDYFASVIPNVASLYFITSGKEGPPEHNPTYRAIKNQRVNEINCIHYPYPDCNKAKQLNFAIKNIKANIAEKSSCYFAFFDIDSMPDLNALTFILNDASSPLIYQMVSKYFTNITFLSGFNRAGAILQTRWSLSFELPSLIINYSAQTLRRLMYFIGHGLIIRADFFDSHDFPETSITEDIALGYKCCMDGIFPKPLPYFDNCAVPNDIKTSILQAARWFSGEFDLLISLSHYVRNRPVGSILIAAHRLFYVFGWLIGPPFVIGTLILSILYAKLPYFAILLFSVMCYILCLTYSLKKMFPHTIIRHRDFFFIIFRSALNFIGPAYFTIIVVSRALKLSHVLKFKYEKKWQ